MNTLRQLILGQEKAAIGGVSAGALSLLGLIGVSGDMTIKEALVALATWVVTHAAIYLTRNHTIPAISTAPVTPIVPTGTSQ